MFLSGYVAIVGVPNAGKSTLLNALVGEKVAIVTAKPQTTRHRIVGILNRSESQILFLDTPGIHSTRTLINETMVQTALKALPDADVILHVVEPQKPLSAEDQEIARRLAALGKPHWVLINKIDAFPKESLLPRMAEVEEAWHPEAIIPISALSGEGVDRLIQMIENRLPEGPPYYPTDQYTDQNMRFLAAEIVREKAMFYLHQEIPYGLTAQTAQYQEEPKLVRIHVDIIVEKTSHKGMVIGRGGSMMKKIGAAARQELETILEKKVYLELFVKVVEGWTQYPHRLQEYGIS